ncbi:MAG: hypothetical protein ABR566_00790 [Pyrinomonadaceae bacterium]
MKTREAQENLGGLPKPPFDFLLGKESLLMRKNTENQQIKQKPFQFPDGSSKFVAQINEGEIDFCRMNGQEDFVHLGINVNDTLLFNKSKELNENQLTIWWLVKEEICDVGFAFDNFGDITLHNGTGFYDEDSFRHYKKKEVRLLGVVIGVIKPFDAQNLEKSKPGSGEITAVCVRCKKQLTGTPEFIKSEGWELEKDKQICLTCDLFEGRAK